MAYLRLSNPTTDSCDYKIYLSNPFNTDYYKKVINVLDPAGTSTTSMTGAFRTLSDSMSWNSVSKISNLRLTSAK